MESFHEKPINIVRNDWNSIQSIDTVVQPHNRKFDTSMSMFEIKASRKLTSFSHLSFLDFFKHGGTTN